MFIFETMLRSVTLLAGGAALLARCVSPRAGAPVAAPPQGAFQVSFEPFAQEPHTIYFAGYDANKAPAHNSAWIYRSTSEAVMGGLPRLLASNTVAPTGHCRIKLAVAPKIFRATVRV